MHRDEADASVGFHQRLRAVAVVHVPVHDQHAGAAERLRVAGRDDDVIEEAEAHRLLREGVVAGGTGRGECRAIGDAPLNRRERDARCGQRTRPRARAHDRVRVERRHAPAILGDRLEVIEISGRMHALQGGSPGRWCLDPSHLASQVRGAQRVEHGVDTLRAFGMARAGVMLAAHGIPRDRGGHGLAAGVGLEQLAKRLRLALHLAAGVGELGENAAIAPPREHDEDARHDAHSRCHEQPRPRHGDAGPRQERGVEQEQSDGHRREELHRTGWRRAGSTMNGAFGTAPNAPSVMDSSSTSAPRNFTR